MVLIPMQFFNRRVLYSIALLVVVIATAFWGFYPWHTPKAYVGVYSVDRSGSKSHYEYPSWIAEVNLEQGEVVDTFPLSPNVPIVQDIAVDWRRNLLYAVGKPNVDHRNETLKLTKGIDIYDIESHKLVDRISFSTRHASIRTIRFGRNYEIIYTDNPLPKDKRQKKYNDHLTWLISVKNHEVLKKIESPFGYRHIISPSNQFFYRFFPESVVGPPGKGVYSIAKGKIVNEFYGRKKLINKGGWQPDPDGRYEEKPYTFSYPQMWGKNPIKIYRRDTLDLIEKVDLEQTGEDVSGGGGGYRETITKNNKYMVSTVGLRPAGSDKRYKGALKVIDLEDYNVEHTIEVGPLITEVDAY